MLSSSSSTSTYSNFSALLDHDNQDLRQEVSFDHEIFIAKINEQFNEIFIDSTCFSHSFYL